MLVNTTNESIRARTEFHSFEVCLVTDADCSVDRVACARAQEWCLNESGHSALQSSIILRLFAQQWLAEKDAPPSPVQWGLSTSGSYSHCPFQPTGCA